MKYSYLQKSTLALTSYKKKVWISFFAITLVLSGCTLKARNQDKFNRLLALANASIENSSLSISSILLKKGETAKVTLIIKDRTSIQNSSGGHTVSFKLTGGTSTGTFSSTIDNADGTYSSTFTATGKGSPSVLSAEIQNIGTVIQTQTITVNNSAPEITLLTDKIFPLDGKNPPLIQGNSYTLITAKDADQDVLTLNCTYQTLGLHSSDQNYAAPGTDCTSLDTITSSANSKYSETGKLALKDGQLIWTPTPSQRGTYRFTISVSDGTVTTTPQTLTFSVRENSTTANLISSFDALFSASASGLSSSSAASPLSSSDSISNWLNLLSSASAGSCSFGSSNPWGGTGQVSNSTVDPYRLTFSSANSDAMSLGSLLSTSSKFGIETWVKPGSPSSSGKVIASNGGGDGNGFVLRQSTTPNGRAEFVIGKKYYSYKDLILSDKPVGYWRLGETAGTGAADLSSFGNNGTYTGGYTLGQTGAVANDSNLSTLFNGSTGYISIASNSIYDLTNQFSIEAWVHSSTLDSHGNATFAIRQGWFNLGIGSPSPGLIRLYDGNGSGTYTTSTFSNNTWHHIVGVKNGATNADITIYVDGVNQSVASLTPWAQTNGSNPLQIGGRSGTGFFNGKLDEVAIYNYPLTPTQITEHYETGKNGNYKAYPGNAVLADHPIGYWRLGEKSGSTAYDSSGNGFNGTYTSGTALNSPGALSTDHNSAVLFNGNPGQVSITDQTAFAFDTGTSIEAWIKISTFVNGASIFNRRTSGNVGGIVLETSGTSNLVMYVYSGGAWRSATYSGMTTGVWYHIVGTYNGSKLALYVNSGTPVITNYTGTINNPASPNVGIGKNVYNSTAYFRGIIDEVAVYNYALSATQVAAHYNAGNGANWWLCQSQSPLSSLQWSLLSAIYNGTTAQLFFNGQQECSVTPGTVYSSVAADTQVGRSPSSTSYWDGALALLRVFGTQDGITEPISASNIRANYIAEVNRFTPISMESIVTDGLVLNLDAAKATQALAPYANGCASSDLSYYDLSSSLMNGTLTNFSSCGATTGWVGDGSSSNPYALAFNGTNNYVDLGDSSTLNFGKNSFTVASWFRSTGTTTGILMAKGSGAWSNGYALGTNYPNAGKVHFGLQAGGVQADSTLISTSAATYSDGNWHYAVAVVDGVNHTIGLYLDGSVAPILKVSTTCGTVVGNSLDTSACPNITATSSTRAALGYSVMTNNSFLNGSLAATHVYNRLLSAQEIKQNCLAQEYRFTNISQSICGAP